MQQMKVMEAEKNCLKKKERQYFNRRWPRRKTSKNFETRGVAWRYNEICYNICVAKCVASKDPGYLFGYRRLDFDKDVQYDDLSSEDSEVDTSTAAKAPGRSTTTTQTQANGPRVKTVPKGAT